MAALWYSSIAVPESDGPPHRGGWPIGPLGRFTVVWPGTTMPGLARSGLAWIALASLAVALPGLALPDYARPGLAKPGLARPGQAWHGQAWLSHAILGQEGLRLVRPGQAMQELASSYMTSR